MKLTIVLEPCEEGGFHAWVPALAGCHSEGETEQETIAGIREAILLYLSPDDTDLPGPPARALQLAL